MPEEEQAQVVEELFTITDAITSLQNQIKKLEKRREGVIIKGFAFNLSKLTMSNATGLHRNKITAIIQRHVYDKVNKNPLDPVALEFEEFEVSEAIAERDNPSVELTAEQREAVRVELAKYTAKIREAKDSSSQST